MLVFIHIALLLGLGISWPPLGTFPSVSGVLLFHALLLFQLAGPYPVSFVDVGCICWWLVLVWLLQEHISLIHRHVY
jgi:hypothetical protein